MNGFVEPDDASAPPQDCVPPSGQRREEVLFLLEEPLRSM